MSGKGINTNSNMYSPGSGSISKENADISNNNKKFGISTPTLPVTNTTTTAATTTTTTNNNTNNNNNNKYIASSILPASSSRIQNQHKHKNSTIDITLNSSGKRIALAEVNRNNRLALPATILKNAAANDSNKEDTFFLENSCSNAYASSSSPPPLSISSSSITKSENISTHPVKDTAVAGTITTKEEHASTSNTKSSSISRKRFIYNDQDTSITGIDKAYTNNNDCIDTKTEFYIDEDDTKLPLSSPKRIKFSSSVTSTSRKCNETTLVPSSGATSSKSNNTNTYKDLDSEEANDITMVTEYTDEIFSFLYEKESSSFNLIPQFNYVELKTSSVYLRPSLRAVLVDWLIQVHQSFKLFPETLFLAINIMDRFMSLKKISLSKLQLVAITSLFIAAKFEEVVLPKIKKYSYMTDDAYDEGNIRDAEMYILQTLQFDLAYPNPLNFLRRISKADGYDFKCRTVAKFFLEYSICCSKFISAKPSRLSCMAMFCARSVFNKKPIWDKTLEHYSGGYDPLNDTILQDDILTLITEVAFPSTELSALHTKYKSKMYGKVYNIAKSWCVSVITDGKEQNDVTFTPSSTAKSKKQCNIFTPSH
ncbi:uncharacterized protein SCODWIG_02617 [Saccharomycodes ludwigii]|uniref:Uncharacterized protein n=1 Tax=Saccharomycodes ludwigii TaxID=36035 RepID=A0A376B868_9ASCO|nr:uncharacterized protein SCODWIG_02617 [Saccharomycodes ludwigii]